MGATFAERSNSRETLLAVAVGIAIGTAVVFIGTNYELRWFMSFAITAMAVAIALMAPNKRRLLFSIYVLSFQADLSLYLLHRSETSSIGTSGPPGIRLPLMFLAACGLALYDLATQRLKIRDLDLGQPVTRYTMWLVGLSALSLVAAPERFIGLCAILNLLQLYVIYIVTLNSIRTEEDVRRALTLLMTCLLFQCLLYFVQVLTGMSFDLLGSVRESDAGGLPRHGGTVSMRAADFASFVLPLTLIATARSITAPSLKIRRRYGALTILGVAAIILTFTRAAWVGTMIGSVVLLYAGTKRRLVSPRTVTKLAVFAVALTIAFFPMIRQRLDDNHSSAYDERSALMQMAKNIIVARPLLGAGVGNYSFVVRDYLTPDLEDKWLWIVHNNYLLRAAETGIPSLIVWLMMLWAMIRRAAQSSHGRDPAMVAIGLGWTAGMVALTWEMYWDIWQGFPYNALMWMLWGLTGSMIRLHDTQALTEPATRTAA